MAQLPILMNENLEVSVARLDGFLAGIVALNGKINDYFAGAFLLNDTYMESLESRIQLYFESRCEISISKINREISFKELEEEIQQFIVENVLDVKILNSKIKAILDRKKYLSFKVMDAIDFLTPNSEVTSYVTRKAIKIESTMVASKSRLVFYCVPLSESTILVLQFKYPSA